MTNLNGLNVNGSNPPPQNDGIVINENKNTAWYKPKGLKAGTLDSTSKVDISVDKLRAMVGTRNRGYVRFVRGVDENGKDTVTIDKIGATFNVKNIGKHRNINEVNNRLLRDAVALALGTGAKYMEHSDIEALRHILGSTAIGVNSRKDNVSNHANGKDTFVEKIAKLVDPHINKIRELVNDGQTIAGALAKVLPEEIPEAMTKFAADMLAKGGNLGLDYLHKKANHVFDERNDALSRADLKSALDVFDHAFGSPTKRARMAVGLLRNIAFVTGMGGLKSDIIKAGEQDLGARIDAVKSVLSRRSTTDPGVAKALSLLDQLAAACQNPAEGGEPLSSEQFITLLKNVEATVTTEASKSTLQALVQHEVDCHYDTTTGVMTATLHNNARALITHVLSAMPDLPHGIGDIPGSGGLKAKMFTEFVLPGLMDKILAGLQAVTLLDPTGNRQINNEVYNIFMAELTVDKIVTWARSFMEKLEASDAFANLLSALPKPETMTDGDNTKIADALLAYTKDFMAENGLPVKSATKEEIARETAIQNRMTVVKKDLDVETDKQEELSTMGLRKMLAVESSDRNTALGWKASEMQVTDVTVKSVLEAEGGFVDKLVDATIDQVARASAEKGPDVPGDLSRRMLKQGSAGAMAKLKAVWKGVGFKLGKFSDSALSSIDKDIDYLAKHGLIADAETVKEKARYWAQGKYLESIKDLLARIDPKMTAQNIEDAFKAEDVGDFKGQLKTDLKAWLYGLVFLGDGKDGNLEPIFINSLSKLGSFNDVVNQTVDDGVSGVMGKFQEGGRVSDDALPKEATIKDYLMKRGEALWKNAMSSVPLDRKFAFVETIMKTFKFLDNDKMFELKDTWLAKVDAKFKQLIQAEADGYKKLERQLLDACHKKIRDGLEDALEKSGKKASPDVVDALEKRIYAKYVGAIQKELEFILGETNSNLADYQGVDTAVARVFTTDVGLGIDLATAVTTTVKQAEGEVTDAINNKDFRTSFFVNGYALANENFNDLAEDNAAIKRLKDRVAEVLGFFKSRKIERIESFREKLDKASTLNDASTPEVALNDVEKVVLGDIAVGRTEKAALASPLAFLGTGQESVQSKLLLAAAKECAPIAKTYRKALGELNKRIDEAVKTLGDKAGELTSELKEKYVQAVRRHFAVNFAACYTDEKTDVGDLLQSATDIFTGMVTDYATKQIDHVSVDDFIATNEIEKALQASYDKTFPADKLPSSIADAVANGRLTDPQTASHKAVASLANGIRSRHQANVRKMAYDILQADKEAARQGVVATPRERLAKILAAKIGELEKEYAQLAERVDACVKKLAFPVEDQLKLAAKFYEDETKQPLFGVDGKDNVGFRNLLETRLVEQMQTLSWQEQYHDALSKLLLMRDDITGNPLPEADEMAIVTDHFNKTARISVLDVMLKDYNAYLAAYKQGLEKALNESGVRIDLSASIKEDFNKRVAAGLAAFIGQYTNTKVGEDVEEKLKLSQILDYTFLATAYDKIVAAAKEDARDKLDDFKKVSLSVDAFRKLAAELGLPRFEREKLDKIESLPYREAALYRLYKQAEEERVTNLANAEQIVKIVTFDSNWVECVATTVSKCGDLIKNSLETFIQKAKNEDNAFMSGQKILFERLFYVAATHFSSAAAAFFRPTEKGSWSGGKPEELYNELFALWCNRPLSEQAMKANGKHPFGGMIGNFSAMKKEDLEKAIAACAKPIAKEFNALCKRAMDEEAAAKKAAVKNAKKGAK